MKIETFAVHSGRGVGPAKSTPRTTLQRRGWWFSPPCLMLGENPPHSRAVSQHTGPVVVVVVEVRGSADGARCRRYLGSSMTTEQVKSSPGDRDYPRPLVSAIHEIYSGLARPIPYLM